MNNVSVENNCPICGRISDKQQSFYCSICRKENICISHRKEGIWSHYIRTVHIKPCCAICYEKEFERLRIQIDEINGLKSGRLILVPDLTGKTIEGIRRTLEPLGIKFEVTPECFSDNVSRKMVMKQMPLPDHTMQYGEKVRVTLSKGRKDDAYVTRQREPMKKTKSSHFVFLSKFLTERKILLLIPLIITLIIIFKCVVDNISWPTVIYITPSEYRCDQPTEYNGKIFFVSNRSGDSEIWQIEEDGTWVQITHDGKYKDRPRLSYDGRLLCYRGEDDDKKMSTYIVNLHTLKRTKIASYNGWPSWSYDTKMIVCNGLNKNLMSQDIYLIRVDRKFAKKQLTNDSYLNQYPAFSPGGKTIIFSSDKYGKKQLLIYNMDSGKITKLLDFHLNMFEPCFSPDGKTVIFHSSKDNVIKYNKKREPISTSDIWIINSDGSSPKRLTKLHGVTWAPVFSTDGNTIYFGFGKGKTKRIAKIKFKK